MLSTSCTSAPGTIVKVVPAFRDIYDAAGWWNEHWGRVKTLGWWTLLFGAAVLALGGFLVGRYGVVGAVAIVIGSLAVLVALVALITGWRASRQPESVTDRLTTLLRDSYDARDRVRNTKDQKVIREECQSFMDC